MDTLCRLVTDNFFHLSQIIGSQLDQDYVESGDFDPFFKNLFLQVLKLGRWHEYLIFRSQSSKLLLVIDACQYNTVVLTNTDRGGFTWNGLL